MVKWTVQYGGSAKLSTHNLSVKSEFFWILRFCFGGWSSNDLQDEADADIAGKFGEEAKVGYAKCDVSSREQVDGEILTL